jgi:hypothetical protein
LRIPAPEELPQRPFGEADLLQAPTQLLLAAHPLHHLAPGRIDVGRDARRDRRRLQVLPTQLQIHESVDHRSPVRLLTLALLPRHQNCGLRQIDVRGQHRYAVDQSQNALHLDESGEQDREKQRQHIIMLHSPRRASWGDRRKR